MYFCNRLQEKSKLFCKKSIAILSFIWNSPKFIRED